MYIVQPAVVCTEHVTCFNNFYSYKTLIKRVKIILMASFYVVKVTFFLGLSDIKRAGDRFFRKDDIILLLLEAAGD